MKICLQLTLLASLLLPTPAAAQEPVRIPNFCDEGTALTIKVPVRFPADMMVQYEWYRNDTLIADAQGLLLPGGNKISYTIPADKAHGDSVVFYFRYNVSEDGHGCHEWSTSRRFVVSFLPQCRLGGIGSIEVDDVSPELDCEMSGAGHIVVEELEAPDLDCHLGGTGRIVVEEIVMPDLDCHLGGMGSIAVVEIAVVECRLGGAGRVALVEEETHGVECRLGGAGSVVVVND